MPDLLKDIHLGRMLEILGLNLDAELRNFAIKKVIYDIRMEGVAKAKLAAEAPQKGLILS